MALLPPVSSFNLHSTFQNPRSHWVFRQMSFTLLLFGPAATYTGSTSLQLQTPMNLKELNEKLETMFPGIQEKVLEGSMMTVNLEYVEGLEMQLKEGDEVAIIPPVSSG
jgi:molybdopterin converting factor small subunit